jgi:hypothetical protein
LDEYDVPAPHYCPACAPGSPIKNSPEEVVKHLMVQHQMNLQQVRELQSATNSFTDQPMGAAGLSIRKKAQVIERAAEERLATPVRQEPSLPICNECGNLIEGTDGFAKARHARTYHKSTSEEASGMTAEGETNGS